MWSVGRSHFQYLTFLREIALINVYFFTQSYVTDYSHESNLLSNNLHKVNNECILKLYCTPVEK